MVHFASRLYTYRTYNAMVPLFTTDFFPQFKRYIKMQQNWHLSQSSLNQDTNSIISISLVFWLQINMQVIAMLHSAFISFAVLHYLISTSSISEASPINWVSKCLWAFSTSLLYKWLYTNTVIFSRIFCDILNKLMDPHYCLLKISGLSPKLRMEQTCDLLHILAT